jgi:hypothetical protein
MSSFRYVRWSLPTLLLHATAMLVACILFTTAARAAETRDSSGRSKGDIVVAAVRGEVTATMADVTAPLYGGAILQLPATIHTGHDGAIELRQGNTTIAAAANTELEIPQSAAEEGLIERIVQISGNAFYNVGKRERSKLRVETPHLVAVIKGTQFNVASQSDSTTIALFEGRLEVRSADESDVIDLNAGEIAIRHRDEVTISVLRMAAVAPADSSRETAAARQSTSPANDIEPTVATPLAAPIGATSGAVALQVEPELIAASGSDTDLPDTAIDLGGDAVATVTDSSVSLGDTGADIGASTAMDLGAASLDASTALDISASAGPDSASVDAGVSAGIDLGVGTNVDVGAGVDLGTGGLTADVGRGVDTGGAAVDVGLGGSVGDAGISAGADVAAGLGGVTAGADVDVAIETNAAANVDVDIGAPGVDAGVEVSGGNVNVDLDLGNIVDVDLNLGSNTTDTDNDTTRGLLDGLLNRRGR